MEQSSDDKIQQIRVELEAKILEQEHRPFSLLRNYFNRNKWKNKDDPRRKAVIEAILWRFLFSPAVLVAGGSIIIGIATLFFMCQQNKIAERQTVIIEDQRNLLKEQNYKIEIQANLQEANRRNNLMFLMDNVLNQVGNELSDTDNKNDTLSNHLIGRITALSHGFQPYRFLTNPRLRQTISFRFPLQEEFSIDTTPKDSLVLSEFWSPERGQLLISLIRSGVNQKTLNKIYKVASFNQSFLEDVDLHGMNFKAANLNGSNFQSTNLAFTKFNESKLNYADFKFSYLLRADFSSAKLKNADFRNSLLSFSHFVNADLTDTNLSNAKIGYIDLKGATLIRTNLEGLDLTLVKTIEECIVDRNDWFSYLRDSLNVKGIDKIEKEYRLEYINEPHLTDIGIHRYKVVKNLNKN